MGGKEKPGVMIYFDIRDQLELMNHEQIAKFFLAILDYASDGVAPEFDDPVLKMAWTITKRNIERDDYSYKKTVSKRAYGAYCRWEKESGREPLTFEEWTQMDASDACASSALQKDAHAEDAMQKMPTTTSTPTSSSTSSSTTTMECVSTGNTNRKPREKMKIPPSEEEVEEYCRERKNGIDPRSFIDYYERTGWKLKGGQKVVDWKACVRTWERNDKQKASDESNKKMSQEDEGVMQAIFF